MWHFMQSDLDVVILEVGMGGRLDAVNVFEPACSIVTSVDLDHMDYLGDTREKIGREKAGIFRANKPAICGDENPPNSLLHHADEVGAELHLIKRDFTVEKDSSSWRVCSDKHDLLMPSLSLRGDFQLNNAACAISAVKHLHEQLPVAESVIGTALSAVTLLGRFYTYCMSPSIILDVAHNPQAAKSLANNLHKAPCSGRTIGVFAMLADKDIPHVIEALLSQVDSWYLSDTHNVRGATAAQLATHLQGQVKDELTKCFDSVSSALRSACIDADKNDRIIVFGSFYTVADAIEVLRG
jgi:dihydrofolate synthase/folylpolyglutamate synthase